MITINQETTNKVILDVTTDEVDPYFLIQFTNCYTNRSTTALFHNLSNKYFLIWIVEVGENGTEDKVNGELKLAPTGDWQADVYVQTSSTNLNINQATFLQTIDVIVKGSGCPYISGDDGCPEIYEIDGGDSGSDEQFYIINGLLDGCGA
jgi:hypothetical protein